MREVRWDWAFFVSIVVISAIVAFFVSGAIVAHHNTTHHYERSNIATVAAEQLTATPDPFSLTKE